MTDEMKDQIAHWILYGFFGALLLVLLGSMVVAFIHNPLAALITTGGFGLFALVMWAARRLDRR